MLALCSDNFHFTHPNTLGLLQHQVTSPLYKPTPLDYLNYPLRYEALFLFLSWHMQRVNKTPSNPLWNCHQFTLSFIKLQNFVFEWRPQMVYHFQNVSRNSVGKVNGNSEIRVPLFQIFCWIKFQAFAAIIRIHLMGLLQLVNVILKQDLPASSSLPNPLQCPCSRFPLANVKWKGENFTLLYRGLLVCHDIYPPLLFSNSWNASPASPLSTSM